MDRRWVKDATDIDKDGSGDVSKESEDDEDIKALRYELLSKKVSTIHPIVGITCQHKYFNALAFRRKYFIVMHVSRILRVITRI